MIDNALLNTLIERLMRPGLDDAGKQVAAQWLRVMQQQRSLDLRSIHELAAEVTRLKLEHASMEA